MARLRVNAKGELETAPIETAREALETIATLRDTYGYAECHPEHWLDQYLYRLEAYLKTLPDA